VGKERMAFEGLDHSHDSVMATDSKVVSLTNIVS
jgi:hypothetical protein